MTSSEVAVLHVPARHIPVPTSISAEAQAMLAIGYVGPVPEHPALGDLEGWKTLIGEAEAFVLQMVGDLPTVDAEVEELDIGGATVFDIRPADVAPDDRRVYLEVHGGGFIQDGGDICKSRGISTAAERGARVWAVDYRMPPDHPYPVPLEDCVAAYRGLLEQRRPEEIIVGGPSAGGNLAAALLLRARDEGLPMPAAAVIFSPCSDLTEASDTLATNMGIDTVLRGDLTPQYLLYANGHDLAHPYLSPVYGDFSMGFPPTMLISGTRDVLLSDTVRLHRAIRRGGVPAELHVWEAAGHAMFLGMAPEDRERAAEVRRFVDEHWMRRDALLDEPV